MNNLRDDITDISAETVTLTGAAQKSDFTARLQLCWIALVVIQPQWNFVLTSSANFDDCTDVDVSQSSLRVS